MSSFDITRALNDSLDPVLFQVVGSTPEAIRDHIKAANLRADAERGSALATVAVFASAVNKATMEAFLTKPGLEGVRSVIMTSFSINGRANMTGLSLLGHCILTTSAVDDVTFIREYRNKLGQRHIWAGNLESGNLSEKQKPILKEKARVTVFKSAELLGNGYWKYIGAVTEPMTTAEAAFWGEKTAVMGSPPSRSRQRPGVTRPAGSTTSLPRITPGLTRITDANGNIADIPTDVMEYYLQINGGDKDRLAASVAREGAEGWAQRYREVMEGGSSVGGGPSTRTVV